MRRILVGIDGSENSHRAAAFAAGMASRWSASVTLINVAPLAEPPPYGDVPSFLRNEGLWKSEGFRASMQEMSKAEVAYETISSLGRPADVLLEESSKGYDLIVLGRRGTSNLHPSLLGSVSSRIVHHSLIHVLIVR